MPIQDEGHETMFARMAGFAGFMIVPDACDTLDVHICSEDWCPGGLDGGSGGQVATVCVLK